MMRAGPTWRHWHTRGFSLIEMIIVMAILVVLTTLVSISIGPLFQRTNLTVHTNAVITEARFAQLKALRTQTVNGSTSTPQSIYFQTDRYTTFAGSTYSAGNTSNVVTLLPSQVRLTTIDVPSQTLTFTQLTGAVANYDAAHRSLTFTYVPDGSTVTIRVNRYGVWEVLP